MPEEGLEPSRDCLLSVTRPGHVQEGRERLSPDTYSLGPQELSPILDHIYDELPEIVSRAIAQGHTDCRV
jgi:hypothetical protein